MNKDEKYDNTDKVLDNKDNDKEINNKKTSTTKVSNKKSTSRKKTSNIKKSSVEDEAAATLEKRRSTKRVANVKKPTTTKVNKNSEISSEKKDVLPLIKSHTKKVGSKVMTTVEKIKENTEKTVLSTKNKNTRVRKNTKMKYEDIDDYGLSNLAKYLFHEGNNYASYELMGSHIISNGNQKSIRFTVWAPNAKQMYVVSELSNWSIDNRFEMKKASSQGIWTFTSNEFREGDIYKYGVITKDDQLLLKSDPYAFSSERRPNTASVITNYEGYNWQDSKWLRARKKKDIYKSPVNIYELHLASWKRKDNGDTYTYRELAEILPDYVDKMGYTHVELMPVLEHPLDDSWGYQVTGYYSVTSRYGSLNDFKYLVDMLHKKNIGVIIDWVPGHFCKDAHGLYKFDGVPEYEYQDERMSENKGWGASNFDLGRREVKSFLISNAMYWFRNFHADGLRVDAVANMLYLDYDRKPGEWLPNKYGENKNLDAIDFFRQLNREIFKEDPSVMMIAEESTSWPLVTKPVEVGGLGFNFKWNMGWMNDILEYIQISPDGRKWNHGKMTFPSMYQYSENFILPISHDEVVHGKKSLINKMWGDTWNKFSGLRLFIAFMLGHPGKKTLFMGSEFGQFDEWDNNNQLQWNLIDEYDTHKETQKFFIDINKFYKEHECMWKYDYDPKGFEWIDADNKEQSIFIFMRKSDKPEDTLIFIYNFKPVVYYDFKIGVPYYGKYVEKFNTDAKEYGGSDQIMDAELLSDVAPFHNQKYSINVKVPPMGALVLGVKEICKEPKPIEDKKDKKVDNKLNVKEK